MAILLNLVKHHNKDNNVHVVRTIESGANDDSIEGGNRSICGY